MNHKLLTTIAVTALMSVPSLAAAQADDSGWYVRGNMGYGTHADVDITGDVLGDVESEGNATGSLGFGYDFGESWRLELDGAKLKTDMGAVSQQDFTSSKLETTSLMLNAIYDFSDFGNWEPYVGAGVGLVQGKGSMVGSFAPGTSIGNNPACVQERCSFKDGDTGLGWQLLAGLGYAVSDNLTWDTHYRYLNAPSFSFDGIQLTGSSSSGASATFNDTGAHSLMTGFRYKFGKKAAMVPATLATAPRGYTCWDGSMVMSSSSCPMEPRAVQTMQCWDGTIVEDAAQCPVQRETFSCWDGSVVYDRNQCPAERSQVIVADLCAADRTETIYYEFDKGMSAETTGAVNRILDIGQYCNVDNFMVVGHTDTSGSAAYNMNLSKKRAADVRSELVRQGVNSNVITSTGMGETQPMYDRGDNVKEPMNRRTEVVVRLSSLGGVFN